MLVGVYLIVTAGWQLLLVGAASILAGVLYTGGPRPYGYEGLGEVFVFLFFGVVAVTGTYFAQREELNWESFVLAVPVGLLATAILMVNNIRDLETDRRAGKRTLAVRLGRPRARLLYAADGLRRLPHRAAGLAAGRRRASSAWLLLPWVALPLAAPIVRTVRNRVDGPSLNGALATHRHAPARVLRAAVRRAAALELMRLTIRPVRHELRVPLRTAWGELHVRELLLVRLEFGPGDYGEGEAAPLEPYDGVSLAAVRAALDVYAEVLAGGAARWRPAGASATSRRRSRRSTSRCGIASRAAPARRSPG